MDIPDYLNKDTHHFLFRNFLSMNAWKPRINKSLHGIRIDICKGNFAQLSYVEVVESTAGLKPAISDLGERLSETGEC